MLLASYRSTRPGVQGIANRLIRWRLRGPYSHSEIVFQPWDGVDDLMPDGSAAPVDGALWCVSSVAAERLPAWSQARAGRYGGVRFKRIALSPERWDFVRLRGDARQAAVRARIHEGGLYDWQQVAGYLSWLIPDKDGRWSCAELCAQMLGMAEPWRQDPCSLHRVAQWAYAQHDARLSRMKATRKEQQHEPQSEP